MVRSARQTREPSEALCENPVLWCSVRLRSPPGSRGWEGRGTLKAAAAGILAVLLLLSCSSAEEAELECATNEECTFVPTQCCFPCGFTAVDDVLAINKNEWDARKERLGCDGLCERCVAEFDPNITSACIESTCQVVER